MTKHIIPIAMLSATIMTLSPLIAVDEDFSAPIILEDDLLTQEENYRLVLDPRHRTLLYAEVNATVIAIHKKMGDRFVKGEVLIELDDTIFNANYIQAKADFERTRAQLETKQQLFDDNIASLMQVKDAEAQAAKAEAELILAKEKLDDCTIIAPYDGKVVGLSIEEYELPQAGKEMIEIVDDEVLLAKLLIPSKLLDIVRVGQSFSVHIFETGQNVEATITRIGAVVDPSSSTIAIQGEINNHRGELKAGMTGTAILHYNELKKEATEKSDEDESLAIGDTYIYTTGIYDVTEGEQEDKDPYEILEKEKPEFENYNPEDKVKEESQPSSNEEEYSYVGGEHGVLFSLKNNSASTNPSGPLFQWGNVFGITPNSDNENAHTYTAKMRIQAKLHNALQKNASLTLNFTDSDQIFEAKIVALDSSETSAYTSKIIKIEMTEVKSSLTEDVTDVSQDESPLSVYTENQEVVVKRDLPQQKNKKEQMNKMVLVEVPSSKGHNEGFYWSRITGISKNTYKDSVTLDISVPNTMRPLILKKLPIVLHFTDSGKNVKTVIDAETDVVASGSTIPLRVVIQNDDADDIVSMIE